MKRLYVDTNILLAMYAPADRGHTSSTRLIKAVEEGLLEATTSTLTLIEIASAVKRAGRKFHPAKESDQELAGSFVRRVLRIKNLEYIGLGGEIPLGTGSAARIPAVYAAALKAVRTIPLRTLDLLHVASAYTAVRLLGKNLDYFATLDDGILEARREVKEFLGCPSVTPDEIVKIETL